MRLGFDVRQRAQRVVEQVAGQDEQVGREGGNALYGLSEKLGISLLSRVGIDAAPGR